ncbi:hypothetical protein LTR94_035242, partial [Friedmanniomyces endolithicus]
VSRQYRRRGRRQCLRAGDEHVDRGWREAERAGRTAERHAGRLSARQVQRARHRHAQPRLLGRDRQGAQPRRRTGHQRKAAGRRRRAAQLRLHRCGGA